MNEISFSKVFDQATPLLMQACAVGKVTDSVIITNINTEGTDKKPFLTLTLKRVRVTSVSLGKGGPGDVMDSVSIQAGEYKAKYDPINPKEKVQEFSWDVDESAEK